MAKVTEPKNLSTEWNSQNAALGAHFGRKYVMECRMHKNL